MSLALLKPCRKCGVPTVGRAAVAPAIAYCEVCEAAAWERFEAMRQEFQTLLAQGIDRRMANRIMEVRVEKQR